MSEDMTSVVDPLSSRTSPGQARAIFMLLEALIFALLVLSCGLLGVGIYITSLNKKGEELEWFFAVEIYWSGSIFALTFATVLLVLAQGEKQIEHRDQIARNSSFSSNSSSSSSFSSSSYE